MDTESTVGWDSLQDLLPPSAGAAPTLGDVTGADAAVSFLDGLCAAVARASAVLTNVHAFHRLLSDHGVTAQLAERCRRLEDWAVEADGYLDVSGWDVETVERVQARVRLLRDTVWTLLHDRLGAADGTRALAPAGMSVRQAASYAAVDAVLTAVDRLEVRGRDSAGVAVWVSLAGSDRAHLAALEHLEDPLFRSGVVAIDGAACFVYKRAAVVGRLGDNVAALRAAIRTDRSLHRLLALPSASVTVLAHTRWASVGRVTEANAHPVDSRAGLAEPPARFAVAVMNGDIDNHARLWDEFGHCPADRGITTDAKLVPVLLATHSQDHDRGPAALSACLGRFDGSMAITAQVDPDQLLVAVKGSGQSVYVGLRPGGYLVSSEVYGLVGYSDSYVRIDGTGGSEPDRSGTVVCLRRDGAGSLECIERWDGAGRARQMVLDEVRTAEVTSRDLDRRGFEHYLEKEIVDAASSFRKTLRGRVLSVGDDLLPWLPESSLPPTLCAAIRRGDVRELVFIGQGTAAVAAQGVAQLVASMLAGHAAVSATPASEFSAWSLRRDMSGLCVVAVSQSGTTTDTNRSVDLARERGATVLAIVNRRDSDLVARSHGVLYTSDGRDVEMAVASTKAFYAQAAAGCLLGLRLAAEMGTRSPEELTETLRSLRAVPALLEGLQQRRDAIADVARAAATRHPHWAVVGSGPNRVAAAEIRIKLSELCYRTVSVDAVEDKKHIDLSAEALVVVCAPGAPAHQVGDLVKEVAILSAHGNTPIVLCDEGQEDIWPADLVIAVPALRPDLAWILTTAAGHMLAYQMAKALDDSATDVRSTLAALEVSMDRGRSPTDPLPHEVRTHLGHLVEAVHRGGLRGVLTSDVAVELSQLLVDAPPGMLAAAELAADKAGPVPALDLAERTRAALTAALEQLARPIDSVKHQAKTVTVGTSRLDADVFDNDLVRHLEKAGTYVQGLALPVLRALQVQSGVVEEVTGVTRYRVEPDSRLRVVRKTGIAAGLVSRADNGGPLTGSKRLIARIQRPQLVVGRSDGRTVVLVPELSSGAMRYMSAVHVRLRERCPASELVAVLETTGERWPQLLAAVTEVDGAFDETRLEQLPVSVVLTAPVETVADLLTGPEPTHATP